MSRFEVTPSSLSLAASLVMTSDLGSRQLPSAGAAAGTPAAGAWSDFVDRADQAAGNLHSVVVDLSRALNIAAGAYELADQTAAKGLQVKR